MRAWLRNHGLSLSMFGFFLLFWAGQTLTGWHVYNEEQQQNGQSGTTLTGYVRTGHFVEATFENWESEYLQMGVYVLFTVFLFERGSSESKDPDAANAVDADPREANDTKSAPWPVRQGGWILLLYEYSLTIVLLLFFLVSFVFHAVGGASKYSQIQIAQGLSPVTTWQFMTTADFWFQSFQNWQSEFLSIASVVVLTVFLRQRGSPESKPVSAPHGQTGSE